mgnify:FL=1
MEEFTNFSEEALYSAQQIAAIAAFELKDGFSSCLILGEGEKADALFLKMKSQGIQADRAPKPGYRYEMIFLFRSAEPGFLSEYTAQGALVLDAAEEKSHACHFDPKPSYRQIRLLSLADGKRYPAYPFLTDSKT